MDNNASLVRGSSRIWLIAVGAAITAGVAVRVWAALQWRMNFDSDEAIFALMARHILQGHFTPVVYGTEHLGSLESILSATAMAIWGQAVPVFRSSTVLLMLLFLILAGYYTWQHWGPRRALLIILFLAFPGFHVLEWTFQPIGGYAAMLALGMAILVLSDRLASSKTHIRVKMFGIGLLTGLGLWANQMTILFAAAGLFPIVMGSDEWASGRKWLVARIERVVGGRSSLALGSLTGLFFVLGVMAFFVSGCPPTWRFSKVQWVARAALGIGLAIVALFLLFRSKGPRRRLSEGGLLGLGIVVGYSPLWVSWLLTDLSPVNVIRRSCPTGVINRGVLMIEQIMPALWGIPPLAELSAMSGWVLILWGILIAFVIVALAWFTAARWHLIVRGLTLEPLADSDRPDLSLLILFAGPLLLSLLGSNTVDIYSVRHLIIAWLASAIIFGLALNRLLHTRWPLGVIVACLWVGWVALTSLSMANGNWRVKFTTYPEGAVDKLVAALTTRGVDSGYADYWGAYTLDYLGDERLTIAPYDGIDRYPAFTNHARHQNRLAFIFPALRSPNRALGMDGLTGLLRLPNEASGEGAAKGYVLEDLDGGHLETVETVGPWEVWIVSK